MWPKDDELARRQREHMRKVFELQQARIKRINSTPCAHNSCPSCVGTGIKADGTSCVHMISCRCPRCSPYSMVSR